jgi:hypothetical protein
MPEDRQNGEATSLSDVIDAIRRAGDGEEMSVGDILGEIGDRSFATALLVPALILVSPVSGIPGVPTIGAIIVILIAGQWILRRRHLWLPDFVLRRAVSSDRMHKALDWFDRPAAFVDRHSHPRLRVLTTGPMRMVTLAAILLIAAAWPPLELLPLATSVGAFAVALLAFGLMTRDGLYVVGGYAFVGVAVAIILGIL